MFSFIWHALSVAEAFLKFLFLAPGCGLLQRHLNGATATTQRFDPYTVLSGCLLDAVCNVGLACLDWDVKPNADVKLDGKIFLLAYHFQFNPTE